MPRADCRLVGENGDAVGMRFDANGLDRRVEACAARQRDPKKAHRQATRVGFEIVIAEKAATTGDAVLVADGIGGQQADFEAGAAARLGLGPQAGLVKDVALQVERRLVGAVRGNAQATGPIAQGIEREAGAPPYAFGARSADPCGELRQGRVDPMAPLMPAPMTSASQRISLGRRLFGERNSGRRCPIE
jgi:hypothetical protein